MAKKKSLIKKLFTDDFKPRNFEKVFDDCADKIQCIFRFLAILEQIQQQLIKINIGEGTNNFWLQLNREQEAEAKKLLETDKEEQETDSYTYD